MQRSEITLVPLTERHWPQVERIYAEGIAAGSATFETETPSWRDFDASRLPGHRHEALCGDDDVVGWVACSPVSTRAVYAGVVEHSVYVAASARGLGVGGLLLGALVTSTEAAGIWTIQSNVFPENEASLRLHAAHGFRVVGTRERIGQATVGPYAGRWRDTVMVERRSGRDGG